MAIVCDVCGEEFNSLKTFCILISSMVGGMAVTSQFTQKIGIQLIGIFLGLSLGLWFIYSTNKKHWNHRFGNSRTKKIT